MRKAFLGALGEVTRFRPSIMGQGVRGRTDRAVIRGRRDALETNQVVPDFDPRSPDFVRVSETPCGARSHHTAKQTVAELLEAVWSALPERNFIVSAFFVGCPQELLFHQAYLTKTKRPDPAGIPVGRALAATRHTLKHEALPDEESGVLVSFKASRPRGVHIRLRREGEVSVAANDIRTGALNMFRQVHVRRRQIQLPSFRYAAVKRARPAAPTASIRECPFWTVVIAP